MNILASYNWIKEYLKTDLSAEEFAKLTTDSGNSVEVIEYVKERFNHMVVGDVLEVNDHPNADKLRVAVVDIGKKKIEIVCGGVNLEADQKVVVGLPGAMVRWHGEGELVELKETKIRGVESYGMICAAEEVGFEKLARTDRPADIWDITELTESKAGTPIAEALELDEVLFDIEVTSNRPDCKSILGQAREGAAVTKDEFVWNSLSPKGISSDVGFSIDVKESELCPRYMAVVIDGVKVGPSPWWLQKRLLLAGHRPINNIVDITNYILHEYGQPLHTFDADTLEGKKIIVRKAKKGESFVALDKETYELDSDMLVIADDEKAVAVAGVMGGLHTGTTEKTTKVVIEAASFEPVSVRRTARALNLYSDSQLLFEKGLSTQALPPALARAIELITELAGGTVASEIFDEQAKSYEALKFDYDFKKGNTLMGIDMPQKDQEAILERLGFEVKGDKVTVPYWRDHDIEASVDFVEEIARVHGYAQFPSVLPVGELPVGREEASLVWERRAKRVLAGAGLTEMYGYAFVSKSQLERYHIDPEEAVHLRNPLSVEHEYMRPSLIPTLLSSIEENQARMLSEDVFEIAPVYKKQKGTIPDQSYKMLIGSYGKDGVKQFYRAKGILERFLKEVGIQDWELKRDTDDVYWHQGRSACVFVDGENVGTIGQIRQSIADSFGLDVDVVLVDLDFETLLQGFSLNRSYIAIAQFPAVKRDIACVVGERVEIGEVEKRMHETSELLESFELFDVYQGKGIDEGQKSIAVHLSFQAPDRTLESQEVDEEITQIQQMLEKTFSATIRM